MNKGMRGRRLMMKHLTQRRVPRHLSIISHLQSAHTRNCLMIRYEQEKHTRESAENAATQHSRPHKNPLLKKENSQIQTVFYFCLSVGKTSEKNTFHLPNVHIVLRNTILNTQYIYYRSLKVVMKFLSDMW